MELTSSPLFLSFLNTVKSKGYFEGAGEEGDAEYEQRYLKIVDKFRAKLRLKESGGGGDSTAKSEPEPIVKDTEVSPEAEDAKNLGNAAIKKQDYKSAITHYTKALQLSPSGPNSHIYYSNRAAAYSHLSKFSQAEVRNLR